MSETLVIIDMQSSFRAASDPKTQQACIREIKKAIKNKDAIIFVEFESCGSTVPQLVDVVKKAKYKRAFVVSKWDDDGGQEIMDFLRKKHLPRLNIKCVGVNTAYCVKSTVRGLQYSSPKSNIKVVADACNSEWGEDEHQFALDEMRKAGVRVINNRKKK